jgi:NAD(P)-dependent dehydrogenase (short-subunit alcohol dehydrogenase family)
MHTSLKTKTTLVTGVSSGIGREIAQLLAERGARVFGTVRNPKSASSIRLEPDAPLHSVRHVRQELPQTISTGLIL